MLRRQRDQRLKVRMFQKLISLIQAENWILLISFNIREIP